MYNKIINPEIIIKNYGKDKYSHKFVVAKCPYCYNFFVAREDTLKNSHTKSCGCLKKKQTPNVYYFPSGCDYVIGFYNNTDGYFLFDIDKFDIVSKHHWTDRNLDGRHEPTTSINGKTTSLGRFLMETPQGLECEHINNNPNDNRVENLRNCTHFENCQNKKTVKQNSEDSSEYSYANSQKIAKRIETFEFDNSFYFYGVLEEINLLPEKNIFKRILRNICRNAIKETASEMDWGAIFNLIEDYEKNKVA